MLYIFFFALPFICLFHPGAPLTLCMCPKSFAVGFDYLIGNLTAHFRGELPILCEKTPISYRENCQGGAQAESGRVHLISGKGDGDRPTATECLRLLSIIFKLSILDGNSRFLAIMTTFGKVKITDPYHNFPNASKASRLSSSSRPALACETAMPNSPLTMMFISPSSSRSMSLSFYRSGER